MSDTQFDSELDCQGLNCPLPILKTKKAMDGLTSGQILKMMATDPGTVNDVQSWTKRTGNPLMNHSEDNGEEEPTKMAPVTMIAIPLVMIIFLILAVTFN